MGFRIATAAAVVLGATALTYTVSIVEKAPEPVISIKKPAGSGYSPCTFTFNPAWFDVSPGLNASILVFRASGCPPEFGGAIDHLLFAYCTADGVCGDVQPLQFPFEAGAEDPRVVFWNGYYYMYYFANGPGQNTVYLRRTTTPLDPSSWQTVASQLPWHRNGCVLLRENGTHFVIFGESGGPKVGPLPGIGIASTTDFVNYTYINTTWFEPLGANNTQEPEIVLEAATPVVQLSSGDYLHLYAAGTPGWVPNGNYTGGWIIMDKDDPTIILQRSTEHLFVPTMDYEIGNGIWPVNRNRTIFTTSVVPIAGSVDTFRVWYGAADANIATAIIQVLYS